MASMRADALATLGRRNLAQVPPAGAREAGAESEGPQAPERSETELFCPCPHCYTNLARTLAATPASPGESAPVRLRHALDVFARPEVLARLVERRKEPLTDLRMVAYYGCKLLRPDPEVRRLRSAETGKRGHSPFPGEGAAPGAPLSGSSRMSSFPAGAELTAEAALSPDPDTELPELPPAWRSVQEEKPLEQVIEACGATVASFPAGGDCCGAALGVAQPEVADELLGRIFQAALAAGAEAIVVACPLCHLNLDLRQYQVSQRLGRSVDIPVFFVTELMAVALGMEESEDWLERHVTSPLPTFMRWIEAQEEREYRGEGPAGSFGTRGEVADCSEVGPPPQAPAGQRRRSLPPAEKESPPAAAGSDGAKAGIAAPGVTSAEKQADGGAQAG